MIQKEDKAPKKFWTKERYYQILAIGLTALLCIVIFIFRNEVAKLGAYGYLGVFLISIISSASIVIPVPGWIIIATIGAILNPILVGIISGLGGSIGEMTGYFLGYGGRIAVDQTGIYPRMVEWMKKWGSLTIFILALIPNPLFDIAGAVAGMLRYPLWKFLLVGTAGRIPKHIFFAYTGMLGLQLLPFLGG